MFPNHPDLAPQQRGRRNITHEEVSSQRPFADYSVEQLYAILNGARRRLWTFGALKPGESPAVERREVQVEIEGVQRELLMRGEL